MYKKIILILLFVLSSSLFSQAPSFGDPYDFVKYFKGEWLIIYKTNPGENLNETQGRGVSNCNVIFNGLTAEFNTTLDILNGKLPCKQIFGFDKNEQNYTLTLINGDGLPPVTLAGEYKQEANKIVLYGYPINYDKVKVKFKLEIVFERADKFLFHFYQINTDPTVEQNKEVKIFEYAYIKK